MTYQDSRAVPIRTIAAIDNEISELELSIAGLGDSVDDIDSRIDSDQYDAGTVKASNMPKDRRGRFIDRTSTLNAATYITAARNRRRELAAERSEMRHRIAELRAERRLWTDKTPLGMLEIAAMLGYSDVAARQWKRRNVLPTPAGSVSRTPYWWRSDVLTWALANGRTRAIVDLEIDDDSNDYPDVWSETA